MGQTKMDMVKTPDKREETPPNPSGDVSEGITELEREIFFKINSTELDAEQRARITDPDIVLPRQKAVLAVHWHPEFVPIPLIKQRIKAMFPKAGKSLIIPTQHNVLMDYDGYSGVEVDCYSRGFNQKVQLLLHFETSRLKDAGVLKSMCAHTFRYRSSQLFEFVHTITKPNPERLGKAMDLTGADAFLVDFVRIYVEKIERLLEEHIDDLPPDAIKNKMLRNFFDELRAIHGDPIINRAQTFLKVVKDLVKADFSLQFFYRTSEVIEEARGLGAGVVIPHPEQFWPILLAEYDVDGVEVWNPQSMRYTEFLISVINEKNARRSSSRRRLLIFMGDDTHVGEKVKDPILQDKEKSGREIGMQPAWDDLSIRKKLIVARQDRTDVIAEYAGRLAG